MKYLANELGENNNQILRLEAQVGGYTGQSFNVKIDVKRKTAEYTSFDYGFSDRKTKKITLNECELKEFIYKLCELNVRNWKKHYQPKEPIMDGTGWSVKLVTDKYTFESEGNNAYPKVWNKFCISIEALVNEDFR